MAAAVVLRVGRRFGVSHGIWVSADGWDGANTKKPWEEKVNLANTMDMIWACPKLRLPQNGQLHGDDDDSNGFCCTQRDASSVVLTPSRIHNVSKAFTPYNFNNLNLNGDEYGHSSRVN